MTQVSDSDLQALKPPPKRRRILDPSAIVPVPVYSSKVSSSLQLKPTAAMLTGKEAADDAADDTLWSQFSSRGPPAAVDGLSDSEEDEAEHGENKPEHTKKTTEPEVLRSPSPPPPESPVRKQSRRVKQKISEVDRTLRAVTSLLSPEPHDRRTTRRAHLSAADDDDIIVTSNDDDVIAVTPHPGVQDSAYSSSVREIPLKVRCRTDVHKIPVLSSTLLSDVLTQLSVILDVPPPRLLLLKEEVELPTHSTVSELGLGIADIIECVVMAAEERHEADSSSIVSVRLQSRDRDSSQEFSLHRDAPLGSVFSQYLSRMSSAAQRSVRFQFDGSKVSHSQTPAELDMEDGDIIEVWI
ncbi:NFATC2-interacting protein 45 kDa NF-AT-interacting protein [Collichthys lucidus]|uniref:NFATC2-interacting protein n=1 Tax=Collichthys lucidus TaxID=240159 RepID=A0A4V6AU37_COLLU|nr:NFATC2-interacting protein 45 kDa NF-AT-interacting protein [Collichthys lucidus]